MPSSKKPTDVVQPGPGRAPAGTVSASALTFTAEGGSGSGTGGTAEALGTTGADVTVGAAAPPSAGSVLTATSGTAASWQAPPSSLPPSGPASGDLAGTYPSPTVTQARGLVSAGGTVGVSAAVAPSSGAVLTATSSTAATWQQPATTLPPSGTASGDLGGTYPSPTVTRTRALKSTTTDVDVSASAAPSSGLVLVATAATSATWQNPPASPPNGSASGDLGGSYPAPQVVRTKALKTATTDVDVSAAPAPANGYVLTATSSTTATWQAPLALTNTAPSNVLQQTADKGSATEAARADHKHDVTVAAPTGTLVPNGANASGSATSLARSDHKHALPAFGTASGTFCEGNDSRLTPLNATINGFRMSTDGSDPIANATSSTLYLTEYSGNQLGLYVTSLARWVAVQPSPQPSLALSGLTTGTLYDVFAYSTDGTSVQLERLAWSDLSNRQTQIVRVNGIWTKSGDQTRRYIGTFRAISANQTTLLTNSLIAANGLSVWNADNRVQIANRWLYSTTSTIGTANSWVAWPNATAYGYETVVGLRSDAILVTIFASVRFSNGGGDVAVSPGHGAGGVQSPVTVSQGQVVQVTGQAAFQTSQSGVGVYSIRPYVYCTNANAELIGIAGGPLGGNINPGMQAVFWG